MPRAIGFSTGSLAGGDFRAALATLSDTPATAVELSALREPELRPLMDELCELDLAQFQHVAVHAPSKLNEYSELAVIKDLEPAIRAGHSIIVHADIIKTVSAWKTLGSCLCIENMDKRKATGRTWRELEPLFHSLPKARFCLDLAHARQIDPTMCEAVSLLVEYGDRLSQIHLSELSSASRHEPLSYAGHLAIQGIRNYLTANVPVILEHEAKPHELRSHLDLTETLFKLRLNMVRDVG